MPADDADDPGAISRDHSMPELPPEGERRFPILSLVGGKWTTFRAFSAEVTNEVLQRLNVSRKIGTENLPIGGGVGLSRQSAPAEHLLAQLSRDYGLSRDRAFQLVARYGSRTSDLAAQLQGNEHFLTFLPTVSHEEIAFVARNELVQHAGDFLFGRSSLFLEGPLGFDALQEIVEALATAIGWDHGRRAAELDLIIDRYRRLHRIQIKPESGEMPCFAQPVDK